MGFPPAFHASLQPNAGFSRYYLFRLFRGKHSESLTRKWRLLLRGGSFLIALPTGRLFPLVRQFSPSRRRGAFGALCKASFPPSHYVPLTFLKSHRGVFFAHELEVRAPPSIVVRPFFPSLRFPVTLKTCADLLNRRASMHPRIASLRWPSIPYVVSPSSRAFPSYSDVRGS